jgi:Ca-activated chloride channel family protein
MFRFSHPIYLLLLLPLCAAAWWVFRHRLRQALLFAPMHRIPAQHATWRTRLRPLAPLFFLSGLALSIVALARPQTVFSRTSRRADAVAIQMVVDCSGSMAALDFSTQDAQRTRLDVVKETFGRFVRMRPGDLVGLITFGGFASSRVPLTLDHPALLHSLTGVEIPREVYGPNGQPVNAEEALTAVGDALATACARLDKSDVKSRIIVLLSDGVSNTGIIKPEDATKAAKTLGIKVYTIGVGSNLAEAPFLARDMFGRPAIARARVELDEDLLRRIAEGTGGQYFNVTDPKALDRALEAINKLEKTSINTELYNQYDEHFAVLLVPAVMLMALGAALNAWLGRMLI